EELEPNIDQWEKAGQLPRDFWLKAGEKGFHCCGVPEEYGGPVPIFSTTWCCPKK
ncbi:MAG: acyl-CoA dehydrogenase, partial [Gammaproteobacteria bacterium]|nr:acyl-CoA dehydrogenase [Gammaproteobacteria bacterium]